MKKKSQLFGSPLLLDLAFFPALSSVFIFVFISFIQAWAQLTYFSAGLSLLGLSLFLTTFPFVASVVLHRFVNRSANLAVQVVIFFLCTVALLSSLLLSSPPTHFASLLFELLGVGSFVIVSYHWWRSHTWSHRILLSLMTLLLSLFIASKVWTAGYLSPTFYLELATGAVHPDTLYHASIASMILNRHIASTGIDGTPFIHYHFGSHLFVASVAKLISARPLDTYQLIMPLMFHPLFLQAIMLLAISVQHHLYHSKKSHSSLFAWLLLCVAYIGFLPIDAQNWLNFDIPEFFSESQVLATLFALQTIAAFFCFLTLKKNRWQETLGYLLLSIAGLWIGVLKISHLYLYSAVIIFVLIRRQKLNISRFLLSLLLVLSSIGFTLYFQIPELKPHVFPLAMFMHTVSDSWKGWWFGLTFFWVVAFSYFSFKQKNVNSFAKLIRLFHKGSLIDLEIVLWTTLISLAPGMLLDIPGGGGLYFFDFHRWIAVAFLMANCAEYHTSKTFKIKQIGKKINPNSMVLVIAGFCFFSTVILNLIVPMLHFAQRLPRLSYLIPAHQQKYQKMMALQSEVDAVAKLYDPKNIAFTQDFMNDLDLGLTCYPDSLLPTALTGYTIIRTKTLSCKPTEYALRIYDSLDASKSACEKAKHWRVTHLLTISWIDDHWQTQLLCQK